MKSNELNSQICELQVPVNSIFIFSLGQAGFLLKTDKNIILIDPYLSNTVEEANPTLEGTFRREFPPPISADEISDVDTIFITHAHGDHCDLATLNPIMSNNPNAKIYAPLEVCETLRANGFKDERLTTCRIGEAVTDQEISFEAIPAAHYELKIDEGSHSPCVGYLITCNGIYLYHSGDTVLYDGMEERIRTNYPILNVVFLVVNGRDKAREEKGIIGNLNPGEALKLAQNIHADLLIPMHNDLFAANSLSPKILNDLRKSEFPDQRVIWLQPGDTILYEK